MDNIKTRFAPSPTGNLHIGNVRIALYSWIFAKKNNGKFILRIEDTDKSRSKKYFTDKIINYLKWLNINWDEGPVYQTDRKDIYNKIVKYMLNNKIAYYCFCSEDRLSFIKKKQILNKQKPKYDLYCRNLSKKIIDEYINKKKDFVIRFKNPKTGIVTFYDWIHGNIKFNNNELDDLIIIKKDGYPTYNFCVAIDDFYMNISHVIRGDDHISNTPKQINILKSINANIPEYIHIPIILDVNKEKLSKKNNNLFNIEKYKNDGLLPHSIIHYLVNFKNQENIKNKIYNINEIIDNFSFKDISKSSIVFDLNKLLYINKLYLINLEDSIIEKMFISYIKEKNINLSILNTSISELINVYKYRSNTFNSILENSKYLYSDINNINKKYLNKYINEEIINLINILKQKIKEIEIWKKERIKCLINDTLVNKNINILKNFYLVIRLILTNSNKTPELYKVIYLLGKDNFIKRINKII